MIGLLGPGRVFAYPSPVDLRLGYSGLVGLVHSGLRADPLSGDLYLFVSRRRTTCKVLSWDGTGFCILMKKLEGRRFPALWAETGQDGPGLRLTRSELALFVEGCALVGRVALSPVPVAASFQPSS